MRIETFIDQKIFKKVSKHKTNWSMSQSRLLRLELNEPNGKNIFFSKPYKPLKSEGSGENAYWKLLGSSENILNRLNSASNILTKP